MHASFQLSYVLQLFRSAGRFESERLTAFRPRVTFPVVAARPFPIVAQAGWDDRLDTMKRT